MKVLWFFASQAALLYLVYLGFVEGSDGAMNVLKFYVWFAFVVFGISFFSDAVAKKQAEKEEAPSYQRIIGRLTSVFLMGILVWFGHIFSGIAMLLALFFSDVFYDRVQEIKKGNGND